MTTKRIETIKIAARQTSHMEETIPAWVPPPFKKFYRYARDLAKKFNKNLLSDHEEELLKEAIKPFKSM